MTPIFIDEILKAAVTSAQPIVLPKIKVADNSITGLYFQHGHPLEIIEMLKQLDGSVTLKGTKYPLVALFRDFPEVKGKQVGIYSEARLNMIFAMRTNSNYTSEQRKELIFKPILYPIVNEFLRQVDLSGKFINPGQDLTEMTWIDHYFWGRESLYGSKANIFNDWIDCIELQNLILKPYTNNC